MKNYIINIVLFVIGVVLMIASGCKGSPSTCEYGWVSNVGAILCVVGLAYQQIAKLFVYIKDKMKKK